MALTKNPDEGFSESDTPLHLQGNFRPVDTEITAQDLPVVGQIPEAIDGLYLRNGPNPHSGSSAHWFVGDGMIHGLRLRGGKAQWYRNRWVQTRSLNDENARLIGEDGTVDFTVGVNNTNIVEHAGKILALVETSFPCELDAELNTVGPYDFGGKLNSGMTAHPKMCPITGEMHFFGYGFFAPYLTYHRVSADGALVQTEVIDVAGPTMIHDFSITENYVLFMDLPVVFDLDMAMEGAGLPYRWDDDYGARLGVMPRGGSGAETKWFDIDPCYVFHPANSFERSDTGAIVLDVARYPEMWRAHSSDYSTEANLHRWEIDLGTGSVAETQLDDAPIEFPRVADDRVSRENTITYAAVLDGERAGLVRYDLGHGSKQHLSLPGKQVAEPVPVADVDSTEEDSGWLMSYVYDKATDSSELWLLEAADVEGGPVARIEMPQRVPMGFHGNWLAADSSRSLDLD